MLNSIGTVMTNSPWALCVSACDLLSVSDRIWHGGHIAAGGRIFPQQRDGHLLPGAGSGLQWICYIRFVEEKHASAQSEYNLGANTQIVFFYLDIYHLFGHCVFFFSPNSFSLPFSQIQYT